MDESLENVARIHFNKLRQSLKYHADRIENGKQYNGEPLSDGTKHMIRREVSAIEFMLEHAKNGLATKGVDVTEL